jgi:ATP-dependent protease HslVU (ClpYQ) peptidase subunit
MTILVAVKKNGKVYLGSDRITTFGNEYVTDLVRGSKIIKLKHAYLATSGYSLLDNIIEHLYRNNHKMMENTFSDRSHVFSFFLELYNELKKSFTLVEPGKDTFASMYNVFLVVTPTSIYGVSTNLSVSEYPRFAARGAGSDYSVGCLYGLYDVLDDGLELTRVALEAACHFNVYCKEPLDILEVKASDFGKSFKDTHKVPQSHLTTFTSLTGLQGKFVSSNGKGSSFSKIGTAEGQTTSGSAKAARVSKTSKTSAAKSAVPKSPTAKVSAAKSTPRAKKPITTGGGKAKKGRRR